MDQCSQENSTEVKSADGTWGWLQQYEGYSRPDDSPEDYKQISYEESLSKYKNYQHAGHAMYFAKTDTVLWGLYKTRACILMQMRFDGMLGFPGGLVEQDEDPITGLNRELVEEIGIDLDQHSVKLEDHIATHLHEKKKLILHAFAKEVTEADFKVLEERTLKAQEYGIETFGSIRPPLFTMGDNYRGFPAFLTNIFCGNSREQLLYGIATHNILTKEEIDKALKAVKDHRSVT